MRMQIGELADRAGVSHRTIHYYERIGLMHPVEREGAGYRYYDETSLQRLKKIGVLKRLGLSLKEIGEVIDLYFDDATVIKGKARVVEILKRNLAKTDARLAEFSQLREEIMANIKRIDGFIREAKDHKH